MKVILTGGGTGGHINPAIAIADALCRVEKGTEILFVGTAHGMENKLVPVAGYPIWHVNVSGFDRSLSFSNIKSFYRIFTSVGEAKKIIDKFNPDAAVGTGGYVCFPIIYAAAKRGIYTALHESNAQPGLAVRMLQGKVDRVFVNFEESLKLLSNPQKALRTGNPMRNEIQVGRREMIRSELGITGKYRQVLLTFGGSLGAKTINEQAIRVMDVYSKLRSDLLHVHACGKGGYVETKREFEERGLSRFKNLVLNEYIYDMPKYLVASDLVICRGGAMTLSELAAVGRASILIPSPNVVDNHQYKNAKAYSDSGAAYMVTEKADELERIPQLVDTILSDRNIRERMEKNCKSFAVPNASDLISADIIKSVRERKKNTQK